MVCSYKTNSKRKMKTFLSAVASDIINKFGNQLSNVTIVFPNKRAALFLNQRLVEIYDKPIWSPSYISINDLFQAHSDLIMADPLKAICELYKCYVAITGESLTLDQFYGWGQLLLSDFDDIDKNLADARLVFRNLAGIHEMDDLSYLTEKQVALIQRFFKNFQADIKNNSLLKKRFLAVWNKLYDIYTNFRIQLKTQGLAYEGMIYREVAENPAISFSTRKYLFVGFNVLHKSEQLLFSRIQHEGNAYFYWDYDHYYAHIGQHTHISPHEAGKYIELWQDKFPNTLDNKDKELYDNLNKKKNLQIISAPTETLQAHFVTDWLLEENRYKDGNKTVIVIANESLLPSIIHHIPPVVKEANITLGFPLSQTPIASFVQLLLDLQISGFLVQRDAFKSYELNRVLRHPYTQYLSTDLIKLREELTNSKFFYIDCDKASLLTLPSSDNYTECLCKWLRDLVAITAKTIASVVKQNRPFVQESIFRMYKLLNRFYTLIKEGDLTVDKITLQRLILQHISNTTIPFHGEPAIGVQIMGILETRNLDFDHVLLLSCNEGFLPKGVDDVSFIPHSLRQAYGLTTIDNKIAIFSYYFFRLLQRAKDVTIVYNTSTDGINRGTMSRFLLQLMVEYNQPIPLYALQCGQEQQTLAINKVEKEAVVMKHINNLKSISPTAINTYIRCKLQYFYKYIACIKEPDSIDDDKIDNRLFGNIFHKAAEIIYNKYLPHKIIDKSDIDKILSQGDESIASAVNEAFNIELFQRPEGTTKPPILNGLQLINREVIERYLKTLLKTDRDLTPFQIIGHEIDVKKKLQINGKTINIEGRIDRIDKINIGDSHESLRVVDYKTGYNATLNVADIKQIFEAKHNQKKHFDYLLQTILYSLIEAQEDNVHNPKGLPVKPALLFIQRANNQNYSPIIQVGGKDIENVLHYKDDFMENLNKVLEELFNPNVSFSPTNDNNICKNCIYGRLCGKFNNDERK